MKPLGCLVKRLAFELGGQISRVVRELAEARWISHCDSGDRHRKGERDPVTGCAIHTWGVDLRPLGIRYGKTHGRSIT